MTQSHVILIMIFLTGSAHSIKIKTVVVEDMFELMRNQDSWITAFFTADCKTCDEMEIVLENIQSNLNDLKIKVTKAIDHPLHKIFSPALEPILIFYRRGYPMKYSGPVTEAAILDASKKNLKTWVHDLSDDNFEDVTQATTDATTSDWLILFCSNDFELCEPIKIIWEGVGSDLKNRVNVARMNRLGDGFSTAVRFKVNVSPDVILIRQGKYYRYTGQNFAPTSFIKFALNMNFQKTKPEIVPGPISTLNDYINYTMPTYNTPLQGTNQYNMYFRCEEVDTKKKAGKCGLSP